jgi:hypothetical protein
MLICALASQTPRLCSQASAEHHTLTILLSNKLKAMSIRFSALLFVFPPKQAPTRSRRTSSLGTAPYDQEKIIQEVDNVGSMEHQVSL